MNQLGIYLSKKTDISQLQNVLVYILEKENIDKFFIVDGIIPTNPEIGIASINLYSMLDYRNTVLFLNIEDFINKSHLLCCDKILIADKNHLSQLSKNLLKNTVIHIQEKSRLRKIKNAELQPLIR
jgi:hypothetical protein